MRVRAAAAVKAARGLFGAPEAFEQVAADAGQQVVALQGRVVGQGVHQGQAGGRALGPRDGHGPVELHHRRRGEHHEPAVEGGDRGPVGVGEGHGPGVAGGDGGLDRVGAVTGALEGLDAAADEHLVPPGPVLVGQQDRLAVGTGAGRHARGLELQQRGQAVHFGFLGHQPFEDTGQAERVLTEGRPQQVVAGRGRVPLVEDEVDHLEHRGEALGAVEPGGHLEGDPGPGQGPLGPHDALGHRGLGGQVGAGDLLGRQSAQQPQRRARCAPRGRAADDRR